MNKKSFTATDIFVVLDVLKSDENMPISIACILQDMQECIIEGANNSQEIVFEVDMDEASSVLEDEIFKAKVESNGN